MQHFVADAGDGKERRAAETRVRILLRRGKRKPFRTVLCLCRAAYEAVVYTAGPIGTRRKPVTERGVDAEQIFRESVLRHGAFAVFGGLREEFGRAGCEIRLGRKKPVCLMDIATLAVKDNFKDVNIVNFPDYVDLLGAVPSKARKKIAVIYADGDIIDGKVKQNVAGDRFASIISQVRADSTVKAVVLRVNSPGGSVLASDKIRAELNLLKQDKPLIASYGDYAASGGYWISSNCDKIYSDAATLTGSIGVFSMIPDLSRTAREIAHINVTSVVSNKHGDMYSFMRPLDNAEYDYMLHSVEDIYDRFTSIVAEGRDLDADYVDSIGQGRVWTGADALGKGLVDEIGTLEDAVRYAAACAGDATLANWKVTGFPAPLTNLEMVMEMLGESKDAEDNIFAGTFLEKTASALKGWAKNAGNGKADIVFARIPFGIDIR